MPVKSQQLIRLPSAALTPDDDCSFFSGILDSYTGNNKKKSRSQRLNLKCIAPPALPAPSKRNIKLIHTWENLEDKETFLKSFSSETFNSTLRLSAVRSKGPVEIRAISFEKLLNDVKLLSIGIESESFRRKPDDPLTFKMPLKFSCGDISDVSEYAEEFLEAGTCFKRLKTFTSKNPFNQCYIFDGFIFQAFCDCVMKFMNHYRDVVYSQEAKSLLEFAFNTRSIRKILIHLSRFLKIHPSASAHSKLPSGSDFLGLLYNEYTTLFDHEVKCFYIECLKSCCLIYFGQFHKWLFNGYIDDPLKELFIYFVDHYRPNTKYFFDKAYSIRQQSVPRFLSGCAETILLCGKYTMLLKSYNQVVIANIFKFQSKFNIPVYFSRQHPLFMLQKPSLRVCLTNEELTELRVQCKDFAKAARVACGPSISIEQIMQEREQVKKEKFKKAEVASTINMLRWRKEQEDNRVRTAERREIQLEGLRAELKRIEENKLVKRMQSIQYERDYLDKAEEIESKEVEKENDELKRRIECYEKLNEQLDQESVKREKIVLKLQNTLSGKGNSTSESTEDVLNANQQVETTDSLDKDYMNNVIQKTRMTEAHSNKLKIISHEFNVISTENCQESNDNPTITPDEKSLTEAQRNKLKVMSHEFGMIETKPAPKMNVQGCDNMTDLQRNRLKVLSHEYFVESAAPIKAPMSLDLLKVQPSQKHLDSPMSVTSDHFSNESEELHDSQQIDQESKSPKDDVETDKSHSAGDEVELEMLRAFEEAIEKNQTTFMGINLNDISTLSSTSSSYEHIRTTDTMALSRYLQQSLMVPVKSYMEILNNETLKMFVQDLDIQSHFKSLRNYFLMMNGEFSSSICHLLFSRLEIGAKPAELLNYESLHAILDSALSQTRYDINIDRLSFIVNNIPEKFELHSPAVFNMLTMSYELDWPLNLILNPETMEQYKAIFNYLLKLKRIGWTLEECFQMLKEVNKLHGKDLQKTQQFRNIQQTRHKMNHFVHCLENHVTRNVLQISWNAFAEDLKSAQSIHCIYRKHTSYLKRVLFLCLLNKKSFEFQKTIEDSFRVILRFHK